MIVNLDKKYIFIHIPKTGGTSIGKLIKNTEDNKNLIVEQPSSVLINKIIHRIKYKRKFQKHEMLLELQAYLGDDFKNYYSFGVVRSPWGWLLSLYKFITTSTVSPDTGKEWQHHLYPLVKDMKFIDFIKWVTLDNGLVNLASRKNSILTGKTPVLQKDWLSNLDGVLIVDKVIKFEELALEFDAISDKIGLSNIALPHVNKTISYDKRSYDNESFNLVSVYFREDIEEFGYNVNDEYEIWVGSEY